MDTSFECMVWNVRGLNGRARRNVVRDLIVLHQPSVLCLQETKLENICNRLAADMLGPSFDYVFLPSVEASGGILLGWSRHVWTTSSVTMGSFSLSAKLEPVGLGCSWWLTVVYGPQLNVDKQARRRS
jgi:hypothetical protein